MTTKKLIACFDVIGDRVTKAIKFQDNIDVASAVDMARILSEAQIDEIVFFDIMASAEKRQIDIATVRNVAKHITVPLIVGGGIRNVADMRDAINAGADKVSVDSMAVRNPDIISEGAKELGSKAIVLSTQVLRTPNDERFPSGYEVYIDGARTATGLDAIEWIKRGVELGAGEICINSIDRDGTLSGYDLDLMKISEKAVSVPLIASGGAGEPVHLYDLFSQTTAQSAIISSMLYSPRLPRNYPVHEIKGYLLEKGIDVTPIQ